jgi:hypothetical protein
MRTDNYKLFGIKGRDPLKSSSPGVTEKKNSELGLVTTGELVTKIFQEGALADDFIAECINGLLNSKISFDTPFVTVVIQTFLTVRNFISEVRGRFHSVLEHSSGLHHAEAGFTV